MSGEDADCRTPTFQVVLAFGTAIVSFTRRQWMFAVAVAPAMAWKPDDSVSLVARLNEMANGTAPSSSSTVVFAIDNSRRSADGAPSLSAMVTFAGSWNESKPSRDPPGKQASWSEYLKYITALSPTESMCDVTKALGVTGSWGRKSLETDTEIPVYAMIYLSRRGCVHRNAQHGRKKYHKYILHA